MDHRPRLALVPDCGKDLRTGTPPPPLNRIDVRTKLMPADSGGRFDAKREPGAGPPPVGGDLPQVPGVRVELLGEPLSAGHVGDIGGEVHTPWTIADCYLLGNSNPRADKNSKLLHHPFVGGIKELEQLRRTNLARLRKKFGPAKLAEATGLSVAHLYQMSEGKPPHARNVNDQHARLIESRAGLPEGWLDLPEQTNVKPITGAKKKGPEWPFPFTYAELMSLDEPMREAAITAAASIVMQARKPAAKNR